MRPPKTIVRSTAIAVGAIYAAILYGSGFRFGPGVKVALAYLPTLLIIGVVAFDLWVWKWPGVIQLAGRPSIGGTWCAVIYPHPDSKIPKDGNRGPIQATVVIEQTYWTMAIRLISGESTSVSTSASIRPDGGSRVQRVLTFTYQNVPKYINRPRSRPHLGTANLSVVGLKPRSLSGSYWTDRLTLGDLNLSLLSRGVDYVATENAPSRTTSETE
ncbi:hypothetical protein JMF97_29115 [Micromonospora fiedleri]|uniref:CD-NTase-associated protein 15 domain-containing protein n=1 Tax=Micromonospora fiedleri TaxID=1157498 RepID=A0ABS1UV31_9ACTN|nr:hypothetical protein [Micromonospora fiedleri]